MSTPLPGGGFHGIHQDFRASPHRQPFDRRRAVAQAQPAQPYAFFVDSLGDAVPDSHIQFLDAVEVETESGVEQQFWIRHRSDRPAGEPAIRATCVPKYRKWNEYHWIQRDYSADSPAAGVGTFLRTTPAIVYQDGMDVVQLPDGRWLMLLHAWINPVEVLDDIDSVNDFTRRSEKDCSFTEIVCYVADDPDFRSGLEGPFRVVDGKEALPEQQLPGFVTNSLDPDPPRLAVHPRLFVGVPAGVVRDGYLYVYYTVNATWNFDDYDGEARFDNHEGLWIPLGGECSNLFGGDLAGADPTRPGRTAYYDAVTATPQVGVAVKQIDLRDLYAHIGAPGSNADQHEWDLNVYAGVSMEIPGVLLGMVQVWITSPVDADYYERFEDVMHRVACTTGAIVDPAPAHCPDTGALTLYFTYTNCDNAIGGGLWRAKELAIVDTNETAGYTPRSAAEFFIHYGWDTNTSNGLVAGLAANEGQYQNGDPVRMPDGSWRVYTGGGRGTDYDGAVFTLNLFEGSDAQGGCT